MQILLYGPLTRLDAVSIVVFASEYIAWSLQEFEADSLCDEHIVNTILAADRSL